MFYFTACVISGEHVGIDYLHMQSGKAMVDLRVSQQSDEDVDVEDEEGPQEVPDLTLADLGDLDSQPGSPSSEATILYNVVSVIYDKYYKKV